MKIRAWLAFILCIFIVQAGCSPGTKQLVPPLVENTPALPPIANPTIHNTPLVQPDPPAIATAYPWQEIFPTDSYPSQQTPTPFAYPYPQAVITRVSTHTAPPPNTPMPTLTALPVWLPPEITALPAQPTPTQAADYCTHYSNTGEVTFPSPDLQALRWEAAEVDGLPIQRLTGLSVPVSRVFPSPNGTGLILAVWSKMIFAPGGWNWDLLVVDGPGKSPWLAASSANNELNTFQWLPDNRLIWVDRGKVYTARADGSEKVYYPLPEEVMEVWSNGTHALVSGASELWRMNMSTQAWSKVDGVGSVTGPSINARLTPDQSQLLVNYAGTLLQIPFDPASGTVTEYEPIEYGGRGGRIGPPFAVGPYYLSPGELAYTENQGVQTVLFKRGSPEPILLSSLIELDQNQHPLGLSVSPDSRWVAVSIYVSNTNNPANPHQRIGTYLTPTEDLTAGKLFYHDDRSYFMSWRTEPAAAFLYREGIFTQISLPSFSEKILGRTGSGFPDASTAVTVIRRDSLVAIFDPNGTLQRLINLPYRFDDASLVLGNNADLYISVTLSRKKGDECASSSWLDVIKIPGR